MKPLLTEYLLKNIRNLEIKTQEDFDFIDEILTFAQEDGLLLAMVKDPYSPFADLNSLETHPNITHIAIAHSIKDMEEFGGLHYTSFWAHGAFLMAMAIEQQNSDIRFHLISPEMITGDNFIKKFDGWIHPGAADSYPRDMQKFTLDDMPEANRLDTENLYQYSLSKVYEYGIPHFGICAGAQNLALYNGGTLEPEPGYQAELHYISFFPGTIMHFLSLNEKEQEKVMLQCEFPEVVYLAETYNNYIAHLPKLGETIDLGAISKAGHAMAYYDGNKLSTQFHIEYSYLTEPRAKLLIDNFIELAIMHSDNPASDDEYIAYVETRLDECLSLHDYEL